MNHHQSIANEKSVLRIIDANANRVREGFRVIEEFCRFTLEDESLTERVKRLRHEVTATVELAAKDNSLLASRDSAEDVGAKSSVESEGERTSMTDVVAASFKRSEEGLRVLEEYSKLLPEVGISERFKTLRFKSYEMEKSLRLDEETKS